MGGGVYTRSPSQVCSVDYNSRPSAIFRSKRRNGRSLFSTARQNGRQTSVRRVYQLQIVAYIIYS